MCQRQTVGGFETVGMKELKRVGEQWVIDLGLMFEIAKMLLLYCDLLRFDTVNEKFLVLDRLKLKVIY